MTRQEWLEWRKQGIGSSDLPIIMDVSPFRTVLQLWEEKVSKETKEDDSNEYIKRKGNEIEPRVRALFEIFKGESFQPALVQMSGNEWARSSLDGRSENGTEILEIKLSGKEDWEMAKSGSVPAKYYPQVQWQLLISNAQVCHYVSCLYSLDMKGEINEDMLALVKVLPDVRYQTEMMKSAMMFWDLVLAKKPPLPSDRDYKNLIGFAKQANKWKRLKLKVQEAEKELEDVRIELIEAAKLTGHPRCTVSGVKIQQIAKIGNVDYKKIPELEGVNLEKYRGKGSLYWKVES